MPQTPCLESFGFPCADVPSGPARKMVMLGSWWLCQKTLWAWDLHQCFPVFSAPERTQSFLKCSARPPDQLLGHHGMVQGDFPGFPRLISCQTTRATPSFLCCCIVNLARLGHSRVKGATVNHSARPTSINGVVWLARWPSDIMGMGSQP